MTRDVARACRLCLVTDAAMAAGRSMAAIVAAAVAGGATMVQVREKTASTRAFLATAAAIRDVLQGTGVPLVINDRIDVALAVGADGVHVGQDDMPVPHVRRIVGPRVMIGLSITAEAQMQADLAEADYLGIGPVFAQATKADAAVPLGLEGLARLRRMSGRPVLAIGGIAAANAASVMRAGADGLAVVSAIMAAADPRAAAAALRRIADEAGASSLTRG